MSDWSVDDLKKWDETICKKAKEYGLDWYPIDYEICDYYEMIGHISYHGMPSHYNHWSYGKSFERTHQLYNLGVEGLPYELIINSNPSIAYLMKQNDLYLQILIMAHCTGHSDFFKNNIAFKNTNPHMIISKFRNAKKRIQGYVQNINIGQQKVEDFIDSVHAVRFQTERWGRKREARSEIISRYTDMINKDQTGKMKNIDLDRILIEEDKDLLSFLIEHGTHFKEWERDILEIVRDESRYFIPQIKTKIMNEGWASFWHYKIMCEIDLDQSLHIPFLKSHNQVIRPHLGAINPYHVGFYIFSKIEKEKGLDECFFAREIHNDESAIRCYLEFEDFRELNIFSYSNKKENTSIDEISDEKGWKIVREDLIKSTGINTIPVVHVTDISDDGDLILRHVHDGRDLDLEYADEVYRKICNLWPNGVKLYTVIEEEEWEI